MRPEYKNVIARNPTLNEDGSINCEIKHPIFGWIPFTATIDDPEEHGRVLHRALTNGNFGSVKPNKPVGGV